MTVMEVISLIGLLVTVAVAAYTLGYQMGKRDDVHSEKK